MTYPVRLGTIADLSFLLSIDQRSCEREGFNWQLPKREALVRSFVEAEHNFSFVVQAETRSIGAIMVRIASTSDTTFFENARDLLTPLLGPGTRFAEIFDLWVEPEFRRQGIARKLKSEIEAECRRRNIEWIFTFQHHENAVAIQMNKAMDYKHVGTRAIYDTIPRVCFLKRVV